MYTGTLPWQHTDKNPWGTIRRPAPPLSMVDSEPGGSVLVRPLRCRQTIVADIVRARERGRFMGAIGAMFAVSSVLGPLLGGWFTSVGGAGRSG